MTRALFRHAGRRLLLSVLAALFTLLIAAAARAHELQLAAHWATDGALAGQLTYSDAKVAEGNYLRITTSGDPGFATIALQTDAQGQFRLPLRPDLAYEIEASGEEGHQIRIVVAPLGHTPGKPSGGPPIYLVLGALLLLSLPLAWRLREREGLTGERSRSCADL